MISRTLLRARGHNLHHRDKQHNTTRVPMAPTNPYNAAYLQQFIYYSLDNNILPTALFLAQRLQAYEPTSPDASYLLSLCYLRLNQLSLAAECSEAFVKTSQHLGCAYIFAQCCRGLERYCDGITALEPWRCLKTNNWSMDIPFVT